MASDTEPLDDLQSAAAEGELGRLGHYRVLGVLGKGGMGQVFRAEDMRLKRQVALKVMNKRFSALPHSRTRFLTEARAVAAIHHDNVVTIFEVGETAGIPFMAMELLGGETLQRRLRGGKPQSTQWILELASQLASGLSAAHQRGIIHRDIKPGNIWIAEPSGRVKLLDFGLALASTPVDSLAGRGSVMGTPGYLSPEQARGEPLDDRSDLFSAGVVLYQLACGQMPFPAATVSEQLIKILAHQPQRPDEIEPSVPRPLADLVMRLLAKEPRDRFRSAEKLGEAIRQSAEEIQRQAQAAASIVIAAAPNTKTGTSRASVGRAGVGRAGAAAAPRAAQGRWTQDKRVWGAASAAALAIVGGLVWSLQRDPSASAPAAAKPTTSSSDAVVLARTLDVLRLTEIPAATGNIVAGEQARFRVTLANRASSPEQDPRVVNRDARVIAQIAIALRNSGEPGAPRLTPGFPKKLSAAMLPAPGESKVINLEFLSSTLPLGDFEVVFELQSPSGTPIGNVATAMTISENLATADLLGLDKIRTEERGGADAFVVQGSDQGFGARPYIEIDRPAKPEQNERLKHAYLRFDLGSWADRRSQIDRALLLLTLEPGGLKGKSTIAAYGVTQQLPQDWSEHGDGQLTWETSPSRGDIESYPFLGRVEIDNRGGSLENRHDEVRLFGRGLDDYLRTGTGNHVSILLVRTSGGAQPTRLVSREGKAEDSPALALRAMQ